MEKKVCSGGGGERDSARVSKEISPFPFALATTLNYVTKQGKSRRKMIEKKSIYIIQKYFMRDLFSKCPDRRNQILSLSTKQNWFWSTTGRF